MKIKEIMKILEVDYPLECAESWDNPGLIVGDPQAESETILVALDASDDVVNQAVLCGASLIITHHPLIFSGVKQINTKTALGRRILKLAENKISCYAMHTNFDVRGMAGLNEKQIGLTQSEVLCETGKSDGLVEGIGRVGYLPEEIRYTELARRVKTALNVSSVRCYGDTDPLIKKCAICGGSGKSIVPFAIASGAQALITGDIDYHTGTEAAAEGLYIIDAGHYGTEYVFMDYMKKKLEAMLPCCRIIRANQKEPYFVI